MSQDKTTFSLSINFTLFNYTTSFPIYQIGSALCMHSDPC